MQEIKEKGAIVNMKNSQFPIEADVILTSLIYLRNTNFKVALDFTDVSLEHRIKYLKLYLSEDLNLNNCEFSQSWIKILNYLVGFNIDIPCILTEEEIQEFIKNDSEYLGTILQFIISIPLFCMLRFKANKVEENSIFTFEEFTKTDKVPVSTNIEHILKYPELLNIFSHQYHIQPLFYTKVFTVENDDLFRAVQNLPFFNVLFGLNSPDLNWADIGIGFDELLGK